MWLILTLPTVSNLVARVVIFIKTSFTYSHRFILQPACLFFACAFSVCLCRCWNDCCPFFRQTFHRKTLNSVKVKEKVSEELKKVMTTRANTRSPSLSPMVSQQTTSATPAAATTIAPQTMELGALEAKSLCAKVCHNVTLLEQLQLTNVFKTVHRCKLCLKEFDGESDMLLMINHAINKHTDYFINNRPNAKGSYWNVSLSLYLQTCFFTNPVILNLGTRQSTIQSNPSNLLGSENDSDSSERVGGK